jgi:UDP-glucose 4-epimerase
VTAARARGASALLRAIVTGGAGFIGSHLVDRLTAEGVGVVVVDDLSSGDVGNLPGDARVEQLDIASADLEPLFAAWRPGLVFHLAAQASVTASVHDPLRDLDVNVVGSHRVAAAARAAGAGRLVFVSSGGAVYGETRRPATEDAPVAPVSYYGIHKLAAEGHVLLAGPPSAIARPSNVYGPRQRAGLEGAVVAAFVHQAFTSGSLVIHGDGTQTRDFIHVLDVVDALWQLAGAQTPTGIWNVASGEAVSIEALAAEIERAYEAPLGRHHGPRRPADVVRSTLAAPRLAAMGWKPRVGLAAGIRALIDTERPRPGRPGTPWLTLT